MHPLKELLVGELETDLQQMLEAGHDRAGLEAELKAAREAASADALLELQERWWARPSPASFPYEEPGDWESISATFPDAESHAKFSGSDEDLADRLHAAWLGRCAGCQLGKPLEGTARPEKIREVLEAVGSWPLGDYMNPLPEDVDRSTLPDCQFFQRPGKNAHTKGLFSAVSPDDDIHYALLSLRTLEEHGVEFTTEQALATIVRHTPPAVIFASGRNAYRTFLLGLRPPHTALFGNPCRQSLGAMIRCDPFGWCAPANPALAARMAYRDAVMTQTRNGIYAGIFFAVLMADVLAHGDLPRAVDTALSYVPPKSRFAEMVRFVRERCAAEGDWQKVNAEIYAKYAEEGKRFNHSLPNGAIVLLGLLTGGGDFSRTICITVMAGMDTDCTGATAGSILGLAVGRHGIPEHWTAPFNDTIRTELAEMHELRISEVAARTLDVAKENARRDR
jgi:ADP-ribosylglycohydrolase